MPPSDPLRVAMNLLRPRLPRLLFAIALGALSLGSGLALAGVSAWLITRAWEMPPVLDLSAAVVAVRAFAISRGVLHYCERLATHDTALSAAGAARGRIYRRMAHGPVDATTRWHSGELVSRVGADVDELADVLVRAVLPIGVAAALGISATAVIAVISAPAAAVLGLCLLAAGVFAPWLAARSAAAQEIVARQHHSDRDVAAMTVLEHAAELRVGGILPTVIAESRRRHSDWARCPRYRGATGSASHRDVHCGGRVQRARGGGGRNRSRNGIDGATYHARGLDVAAAVRFRGDGSAAGRRGSVDTIADRGAAPARLHSGRWRRSSDISPDDFSCSATGYLSSAG